MKLRYKENTTLHYQIYCKNYITEFITKEKHNCYVYNTYILFHMFNHNGHN